MLEETVEEDAESEETFTDREKARKEVEQAGVEECCDALKKKVSLIEEELYSDEKSVGVGRTPGNDPACCPKRRVNQAEVERMTISKSMKFCQSYGDFVESCQSNCCTGKKSEKEKKREVVEDDPKVVYRIEEENKKEDPKVVYRIEEEKKEKDKRKKIGGRTFENDTESSAIDDKEEIYFNDKNIWQSKIIYRHIEPLFNKKTIMLKEIFSYYTYPKRNVYSRIFDLEDFYVNFALQLN